MASRRKRDDARLAAKGKPPGRTMPATDANKLVPGINGRPSKLNDAAIESLSNAFRLGLPMTVAAGFVHVQPTTVADWLARGQEDLKEGKTSSQYARLSESVSKAISDRCAESLVRIRKAAQGGDVVGKVETIVTAPDGTVTRTLKEKKSAPQWTADAWYLERTRPKEFGRLIRTEITGADGGPVESKTWLDVMKIAQGKQSHGKNDGPILDAEVVETETDKN